MKIRLPLILGIVISIISVLCIPSVLAAPQNLVPNPSVETADPANANKPQDWITDKWGTNTSAFSVLSTGRTGNKSLKVETTSYTSGDAKWYYTPQTAV